MEIVLCKRVLVLNVLVKRDKVYNRNFTAKAVPCNPRSNVCEPSMFDCSSWPLLTESKLIVSICR